MRMETYRKLALNSGLSYEAFIHRSLMKSEQITKDDFNAMNMTKLILRENEESEVDGEDTTESLLAKVKGHLLAGVDRFLAFDLKENERAAILEEKEKIAVAKSSEGLIAAMHKILSATHRFRYGAPGSGY